MTEAVYVIAEAGVNHNGSLAIAHQLVDAAAGAGADAVKFQTFEPQALVTAAAPKAGYQLAADGPGRQRVMLERLALSPAAHHALAAHCRDAGIDFLSTAFDTASADFLAREMALPRFKVPSGEITNAPLLLRIARFGRPLILSTGMSTLDEVAAALGVLAFGYTQSDAPPSRDAFRRAMAAPGARALLRKRVTLLHCTSAYPCPPEQVNLRAMETLSTAFGLPVGYSDHTQGIAVPIAASARGAQVIEKHFTLDRGQPGPDHRASLEPPELRQMVLAIRSVEAALGNPEKGPTPAESENLRLIRKGLVATRTIRAGERFQENNITSKRPASGLSPMRYWDLLGQPAPRDYAPDEPLE